MMPPTLDNFCPSPFKKCANAFQRRGRKYPTAKKAEAAIPGQKELLIFKRIAQEACCNALKHARASNIAIGLVCQDGLQPTVTDNGVGFDLAGIKHKVGGRQWAGAVQHGEQGGLCWGRILKTTLSGTVVSVVVPLMKIADRYLHSG